MKLFADYVMYYYILSAKSSGNMAMVVLVRNDINIVVPTIQKHRRYNIEDEGW